MPYDSCFNPHRLLHYRKTTGLRKITTETAEKYNLDHNLSVCKTCRNNLRETAPADNSQIQNEDDTEPYLSEENNEKDENDGQVDEQVVEDITEHMSEESTERVGEEFTEQNSTSDSQSTISPERAVKQSSNLSVLSLGIRLPEINLSLRTLDVSPIKRKRLNSDRYINKKTNEVNMSLKTSLGASHLINTDETDLKNDAQYFRDLIESLKVKFNSPNTNRATKIQILTLLPPEWSTTLIVKTMNATQHMAREAKKLVHESGILSLPSKRSDGKSLSEDVKKTVIEFYQDSRNSAMMAGKKDYLSVKDNDGVRTHVQKQLVLFNLDELFERFQESFPNIKISYSKFKFLRPKHCVLAGSSGIHTVYVCSNHQNVKLMISGCKLAELSEGTDLPLTDYSSCINTTLCLNPSENCFLGYCNMCPKTDMLMNTINKLLEENFITQVKFKESVTKPRCSLKTSVLETSEFTAKLCSRIDDLKTHDFIAKTQGNFLKNLKMTLQDGEYIVICDFAENYAFVVQDAAPGFHWNNNQVTIYTVVIYFQGGHRSLVVLSDNPSHDTIAVHIYTQVVVNFIKSLNNNVKKIFYFSDGAPQHFKNYKNIVNQCYYVEDFGFPSEWHFFATAHGKGPCDGIGGTLKRQAARVSLQRPSDNQITTVHELFDWASNTSSLPSIEVKFSPIQIYNEKKDEIEKRFSTKKRIPNLKKLHCFIPQEDKNVLVKEFSTSFSEKIYKII